MRLDGFINEESHCHENARQHFCSKLLSVVENYNEDVFSLNSISKQVWAQFSRKHQKSPTHVNNNVQKCSNTKNRHSTESTVACQNLYKPKRKYKTNGDFHFKDKLDHQNPGIAHMIRILLFCVAALKFFLMIATTLVLFYCIVVFHKPTQTFISRNTQDWIYPIMKTLRTLTLPFIHHFPALTNLYEESCLINNPFFVIDNVDCWPCETVRHIPDLTGLTNFSTHYHHSGIPFIVKDAVNASIGIEELRSIFQERPDLFSKLVDLNLNSIISFDEFFDVHSRIISAIDLHIAWKVNRVAVARLFRDYFPKPYFIPTTTEVSVQHYLYLDNPKSSSHILPITEFANVFLTQASGSRHLILIPTENCQQKCRVVSAILHPKDVLFYNWLFWRPMSAPVESSKIRVNTSVTYIGSFY